MIENGQPYIEALSERGNERLLFHFDTGNARADLHVHYYEKHKAQIEAAGRDTVNACGYGGTIIRYASLHATRIPAQKVEKTVCEIENIDVNTRPVLSMQLPDEDGALGMDFIRPLDEVTVDFDRMSVRVRNDFPEPATDETYAGNDRETERDAHRTMPNVFYQRTLFPDLFPGNRGSEKRSQSNVCSKRDQATTGKRSIEQPPEHPRLRKRTFEKHEKTPDAQRSQPPFGLSGRGFDSERRPVRRTAFADASHIHAKRKRRPERIRTRLAPRMHDVLLTVMIRFVTDDGESPVKLFGENGPDDLVGKRHARKRQFSVGTGIHLFLNNP